MRTYLKLTGIKTTVAAFAFVLLFTPIAAVAQTDGVTPPPAPPATTAPTSDAPTDATPAATVPSSASDAGAGGECSANPATWPSCLIKGAAGVILLFTNTLLGIAGTLFNWAVVKTVFQFSQFIGNSEGLLIAWGIMRDIGNILVLFGFVLIAIGTVLNIDKMPNKRMLPGLIIFAILLNFSLFVSEAIIDVSNALAASMYQQANTSPCLSEPISQTECALNYGIAGHIMQSTGLGSILTLDGSLVTNITVLLGLIMFSLVGFVVLLAAAIMILIRGVVLSFLMILSPIGFAGLVIPPLKNTAKSYWNTLVREAFFAPILILLILVSLKVTDGFSQGAGSTNGGLAAALAQPNATAMGVLLIFFIVIGFLVASLVAAKQFGAMGADAAIKFAGGASFGAAGWVGRRTFGRKASEMAEELRKNPKKRTEFGRFRAGIYDSIAKSSFDARPGINKNLKTVLKKNALDFGAPSKTAAGGYSKILDEETKKRKDFSGTLKDSPEEENLLKTRQWLRGEQEATWKEEEKALKKREKDAKASWDERRKKLEDEKVNGPQNLAARKDALAKEKAELEARTQSAAAADTPEARTRLQNQIQAEKMNAESMRRQLNSAGAQQAEENAQRLQAQLDALGKVSTEDAARLAQVTQDLETADETHAQRMRDIEGELAAGASLYSQQIQGMQIDRLSKQDLHEKEMEKFDDETKAGTAQGKYATNLKNSYNMPGTMAKPVSEKAAKDILKGIKLKKSDQSLQGLKDALAKAGVKDADAQAEAARDAVAETSESKDDDAEEKS